MAIIAQNNLYNQIFISKTNKLSEGEFLIKLYIKSVKANIQTNTFNFFFIFFNLESVGNEWQRACIRKVACFKQ